MTTWLNPVRLALDARLRPLSVFFRDDDAGWERPALDRLLAEFEAHGLPIDLAVIPAVADETLATHLLARRRTSSARLGLHQHGWAHTNHEREGRKCEFGPSRRVCDVGADLTAGHRVLADRLADALDPIFTPPWNRCVPAVGPMLVELGITVLSRDRTAPRLGVPGLVECPTHIDWFAKHHGIRVAPAEWARAAAEIASADGPIGILLHHAAMDEAEFQGVAELLALLSAHPHCRPCSLLEAASLIASAPMDSATAGHPVRTAGAPLTMEARR